MIGFASFSLKVYKAISELPFASVSKKGLFRSYLYENATGSFSYKSNSFSYQKFCTKTHFENDTQGNSVIAYLIVERKLVRFLLHSVVRRDFVFCVANL